MQPDVTILMPCLNEAKSLAHCIANAREALLQMAASHGLRGEIVVADNGSTDGSQELAERLGARVVRVSRKGYGAAIIGGCREAEGRYLVIGDADGSYDFTESVAMVAQLVTGIDLSIGSRFTGGINPGAMPWKNRYIGNPALTGILNLFFDAGIQDAHCGLRAITRQAFLSLGLGSEGMEFASEMIVKASLRRLRIAQVPVTLSKDLRDRRPHLRPWRDGWRHLRYLVMLSPTWAFGVPALMFMGCGALILGIALLHFLEVLPGRGPFGESWSIVAGFMLTSGHFAAVMAIAMHIHGVREGYRALRPSLRRIAHLLTLERIILLGMLLIAVAIASSLMIAGHWAYVNFTALPTVLPLVLAAVTGSIGLQTILGAFVLAIVGGHSVSFAMFDEESEASKQVGSRVASDSGGA